MTAHYYTIEGRPIEGLEEGRQYFVNLFDGADSKYKRRIAHTILSNGLYISTIFLGVNYGFGAGRPLLFETMAFIQPTAKQKKLWKNDPQGAKKKLFSGGDIACERWSTREEALVGHNAIVAIYNGEVEGIPRRKRWTKKT